MTDHLNETYTLSVGGSVRAKVWKSEEWTLAKFIDKLANPRRTAETTAEYAAMDKSERSARKDVGGYVGGTLKGTRRAKGEVESRSLITLNLDEVTVPLEEALAQMERVRESFREDDAIEDAVLAFLEIPIPENWKELSLLDRRHYYATYDPERPSPLKTVLRQTVTGLEFWVEYFGGNINEFPRSMNRAVNSILAHHQGWTRSKERPRLDKIYGGRRPKTFYVRKQGGSTVAVGDQKVTALPSAA